MASARLHPNAKCYGIDLKKVNVRIFPNNTGVPTWTSEGGVTSVERSSAGKFLITLDQGYYRVRNAQATFQTEEDNRDMFAQIGLVNNVNHNGVQVGTAGQPTTVEVRLKTATANTDVVAGAQRCIFVDLEFEDSPQS